ncbi:MAG TPA: efflux RND transporter periplasmic adaptor subunit [Patescibacteria group bacterium]|nr:efflux RND transporter periplasmic adaptor subunit [Patescibacteria group bacterium]
MRRSVVAIMMIFILTWTAGCSISSSEQAAGDKRKPIGVLKVQEEKRPIALEYTGIVGSEELKKLAFKSGGKIKKIFVKQGEQIEAGQPLIQLDDADLAYAISGARGQMDAAKAQYDKAINGAAPEELQQIEANVKKAQDSYNFTKDNYEKFQKLFQEGAISQNDLDQAKLELDIRESDLKAAKEIEKQAINGARDEDKAAAKGQWEQAQADYDYKRSLMEDATIKSDSSGYVVDVLYEEGELVASGYPVLVVRNDNQVVKAGLSSKDFEKVTIGTKARIRMEERIIEGEVTNIGQTPDSQTRTYPIEIALSEKTLPLGSVVKLDIIIGEESGVWIPITAIMANGEDYVYVVRDEKASRRIITLGAVNGDYVKVQGLENNDQLVIKGMQGLKDQDQIAIQE